jgi:hypothetical protein
MRRPARLLRERSSLSAAGDGGAEGEGAVLAPDATDEEAEAFFRCQRPPTLSPAHSLHHAGAGGTRRVRLVREEGRGVSSQYGREGGGGGRT